MESERRVAAGAKGSDAADQRSGQRGKSHNPGRCPPEHPRRCTLLQTGLREDSRPRPEPDRTWFALAAYNIGYGHVEDARVLAQKAGRDPDSWQDVREFLPLLAQEYWYTQTENGYAHGWEPVRYVDNVRGYRDMLEWVWGGRAACAREVPQPDPAPRGEKIPQQRAAFLTTHPAENIQAVVQARFARQIEHAAAGAGLGSQAPNTTRDTRALIAAPMHMAQGSNVA